MDLPSLLTSWKTGDDSISVTQTMRKSWSSISWSRNRWDVCTTPATTAGDKRPSILSPIVWYCHAPSQRDHRRNQRCFRPHERPRVAFVLRRLNVILFAFLSLYFSLPNCWPRFRIWSEWGLARDYHQLVFISTCHYGILVIGTGCDVGVLEPAQKERPF